MDTRLFHRMFGPLQEKTMSPQELDLVQRLHPQTFSGYPRTTLSYYASNPALNEKGPNDVGYEGIFNRAASIFSPEDPQAFGRYIQQNLPKMDAYGIKKLFDYVHWLNQTQDMQSTGSNPPGTPIYQGR